MNDTNLTSDRNPPDRLDLEVRIVAWVLGEASGEEVASLEQAIDRDPELARFKMRVEETHRLADEAAGPAGENLRLDPGRRASLLAAIGEPSPGASVGQPVVGPRPRMAWWRMIVPAGAISVAASFILIFGFLRVSLDRPATIRPNPGTIEYESEAFFSGDLGRRQDDFSSVAGQSLPATTASDSLDKASPGSSSLRASREESERRSLRQANDLDAARPPPSAAVALPEPAAGPRKDFRLRTAPKAEARTGRWDGAAVNEAKEVFALSPFELQPDETYGYASDSTVAGVRLKKSPEGQEPSFFADADAGLEAEVPAGSEPVSTFSMHVSDVSFRLALAALDRGRLPDPETIRPEEFYNAFDYGDPSPVRGEPVAARIEQSAHPFLQQRNLVRIALKVPATGRMGGQALRLTLLLDTSGSMQREDRRASVRSALQALVSLLGPDDRISLVGFARQPRLLEEAVPGDQVGRLVEAAERTPAEGGTHLEAALVLAGEIALRHYDPNSQNRIVLITDGAANLGNADPDALSVRIEDLRRAGIAFDACGVGLDGLDDAVLEALTRKGDGRYTVIDQPGEVDAAFARKLAGAFRPAASDVKVQVRFNPARVGAYRLIGFERHRLSEEDFRDDTVDAAELAADEGAVALYQVEVQPEGEGELGEVFVRFHDNAKGIRVERSWPILHQSDAPAFDRAPPGVRLAGISALVAEGLMGRPTMDEADPGELLRLARDLERTYGPGSRVNELVRMLEQLVRMR